MQMACGRTSQFVYEELNRASGAGMQRQGRALQNTDSGE